MKILMPTAILSSWKTIYPIMIRARCVQLNSPDFDKLGYGILLYAYPQSTRQEDFILTLDQRDSKFEIRNPKHETNSKHEITNSEKDQATQSQGKLQPCWLAIRLGCNRTNPVCFFQVVVTLSVFCFYLPFWSFGFRACFGFRYLDFGFDLPPNAGLRYKRPGCLSFLNNRILLLASIRR
jgi:hypothetical protein